MPLPRPVQPHTLRLGKMDSDAKSVVGKSRWLERGLLAAVCALVVGVYAYTAHSGFLEAWSTDGADSYYNLLVRGFRAGQLNLKTQATPWLAHVANPYDPDAASRSWELDMSYYKGKLYLYYGVTPAVVLLWPYAAVTGHYLFHRHAVVIFCTVGFLAGVGILCALWRRYFAEVSVGVVAAATLALGLANFAPFVLAQSDVYEVSITCGYAFTMLALAAIWKALHVSSRRSWWLAAASLAYGLAVGARPSLLFGAAILIVPVAQAYHERRNVWSALLAATGPIALIGLGLMLYNAQRFDNPFEFGTGYQLSGDRRQAQQLFSLRHLWFNVRVYFLKPARWSALFPFVHDIAVPPMPAGHGLVEHPFGILTNIPLVWLALALPLAWRDQSAQSQSCLCGFLKVLGILFGICTLTICLFYGACARYEMEFLPALLLLAIIGVLSLERATIFQSGWRLATRWAWVVLLFFSVAFNLLASVARCGEAHYYLGLSLNRKGKPQEAIPHYEQAVSLNPDLLEAQKFLGDHLLRANRLSEAIPHFEQALRLNPDSAEAHNNLAAALMLGGRLPEAVEQFQQALRIIPDLPEAHSSLAATLMQMGKLTEAVEHYEHALRSKPDDAETHYDLGRVLEKIGCAQEAAEHYQMALCFKPNYVEAQNRLAQLQTAP